MGEGWGDVKMCLSVPANVIYFYFFGGFVIVASLKLPVSVPSLYLIICVLAWVCHGKSSQLTSMTLHLQC